MTNHETHEKILLVDDMPQVREALARGLSRRYDVTTAASAAEALERCEEEGPFPVLVCDYGLPDCKGPALLGEVRRRWPETVAIMLTGLADPDVAVDSVNEGRIYRFLSKPCSLETLEREVEAALQRFRERELERVEAERLLFTMDSYASFADLLEERIAMQATSMRRMHEFATDLVAARSLEEIAEMTSRASHEILGGRGVHVQVWDPDGAGVGIEADYGPEMSCSMHREPLRTRDGAVGEIVVDKLGEDGHELTEEEYRIVASIASSTAVAAHNELRRRERDQAQHMTILALARLAEQRDNETGRHLERVALYCKVIAEGLRTDGRHAELITEEYVEDLVRSSPLHDIGKVGIPDSILLKPGKLTPDEWTIMKTHTEIGSATLESVIRESAGQGQGFLHMGRDIAGCHHEKWDGTGYPRGLRGEDIPLSARILALADVYDALTTERPYKHAWTHDEAVTWIAGRSGTHFDPEVVETFLARADEADEIRSRLADDPEDARTGAGDPLLRAV